MKVSIGLSIFLLIAVGCSANSPETAPEESTSTANQATETRSDPDIAIAGDDVASGSFVTAEHETTGTARVVSEDGTSYVVFDEQFQTDPGPDLFILLHRSQTPQSYEESEFVNLGELQQTRGTQRYEIPGDVNPQDYASVVVWCRQFNVTFGYAPLTQ